MHVVIATRGIKHDIDRFITELQGKYLPYTDGKDKYAVQLMVQPIQLWSVVFPEEQYDTVMNTIKPNCFHKSFNKLIFPVRKLLGLKKAPKVDINKISMPIFRPNAEIVVIGVKKDGKLGTGGEAL